MAFAHDDHVEQAAIERQRARGILHADHSLVQDEAHKARQFGALDDLNPIPAIAKCANT